MGSYGLIMLPRLPGTVLQLEVAVGPEPDLDVVNIITRLSFILENHMIVTGKGVHRRPDDRLLRRAQQQSI